MKVDSASNRNQSLFCHSLFDELRFSVTLEVLFFNAGGKKPTLYSPECGKSFLIDAIFQTLKGYADLKSSVNFESTNLIFEWQFQITSFFLAGVMSGAEC